MDNLNSPITPTPNIDMSQPAPAPAAPAPVAPVAPVAQQMDFGGPTPSSNWFAGITVVDVGVIALVSLALFYSIYHTRQQIFYLKNHKDKDRQDIDELQADVRSLMPQG